MRPTPVARVGPLVLSDIAPMPTGKTLCNGLAACGLR